MTSLNIVFAGTPAFGIPCLEAIHKSQHNLLALFTQPDRPAGRGQKLQFSAVKTWGLAHNLPIYQPLNFRSQDAIEDLIMLKPDLMVVIAYGLLLPPKILSIPRLGCINVHASLLPRWRGASPIQQAILAGDHTTGITIMQMDAGMDTGDGLTTLNCTITSTDTTASLQDRLSQMATEPLLQTIDALANQQATATPQAAGATHAPKIKKQDAEINWHQSAAKIDCHIRGYYPWPIAYTQGNDVLFRIHQASVISKNSTQPPGTILAIDTQGVLVNTTENAILIQTIQCPGGKPMSIADYLNAKRHDLVVGLVLQ